MERRRNNRQERRTFSAGKIGRRGFLSRGLGGLLGLGAVAAHWNAARAAKETADSVHGPIKISDIEVHDITVDYEDWIAYQLNHYYGPTKRTVYVVHTNTGLTGLGDGSRESDEVIEKYVGTSPFDWVGDETSLPLGTAMYDLMGKAAGVPVYKLFGQRYRRWVPVGSWTVSTHPKRMAEAVQRYAARGYTWLKYHLSPFENVFDQTEAMQAVAPKGFKIHYDLTMGGTDDHMFDLLERMARYPIAGCLEDPLPPRDIDGYAELRKRVKLPVVLHHVPLGATYSVLRQAADIYMLGHAKIGVAMRRAGLFDAADVPFMLQNVGGHITRSMTTHMQAAFKTASFHFHCDAETWKSDVVKERPEPVNGFVRVSEEPGLGVTLDRAELERLKKLQLPEQSKWIIKSRFGNGTVMYNIADPKQSIFMVRPDVRRLIPMSYESPVTTEYWDDDGSQEYKSMFGRIEREGVVLLKG
jgi:L-alanine-DL-glutamate epimerase-like enolase superfamily enzyme